MASSMSRVLVHSLKLRTRNGLSAFTSSQTSRWYSSGEDKPEGTAPLRKAKTPVGRLDDKWEQGKQKMTPPNEEEVYEPFHNDTNPETGEIGGPKGPEPTRYGDWERKGRVIDF